MDAVLWFILTIQARLAGNQVFQTWLLHYTGGRPLKKNNLVFSMCQKDQKDQLFAIIRVVPGLSWDQILKNGVNFIR